MIRSERHELSVALRELPIPSPTRAASFSVARPSRPARGTMATQVQHEHQQRVVRPRIVQQVGHRNGEQQPRQPRLGQDAANRFIAVPR